MLDEIAKVTASRSSGKSPDPIGDHTAGNGVAERHKIVAVLGNR
jgi:hypothetical protein